MNQNELEHRGIPRGRKKRVTGNSKGVQTSFTRAGRTSTLAITGEDEDILYRDFYRHMLRGLTDAEIKFALRMTNRSDPNPRIRNLLSLIKQQTVSVGRKPSASRDQLISQLRNVIREEMSKEYAASRALVHMSDDELEHFGILGMKWGVRRYQNEDGSLTDAGRKRYGVLTERYNQAAKSAHQTYSRATDMVNKANARVNKADEKLHKFNAKLGYEAPHMDKNPLKGQQPNQQQNNVPKPQGEQKQAPQAPQQNQQSQQPKPSNNELSPNYWTKPVKQMNDTELKAYADRLANQKRIEDALKPSTPANSEQVNKKAKDHKVQAYVAGEIKNLGKDAVADVRREASKRLARHFMSTYLGWESGNNNNNNK